MFNFKVVSLVFNSLRRKILNVDYSTAEQVRHQKYYEISEGKNVIFIESQPMPEAATKSSHTRQRCSIFTSFFSSTLALLSGNLRAVAL